VNKWIKIDDEKIRHIWQCPECDKLTTVSPHFYEENGTPVCPRVECGCDMVYLSTEFNNG